MTTDTVTVPREPTEAMRDAAYEAGLLMPDDDAGVDAFWKAMLASAPPAPVPVTLDMAVAGARSIANTAHTDNHVQRARDCFNAMIDARRGIEQPIPSPNSGAGNKSDGGVEGHAATPCGSADRHGMQTSDGRTVNGAGIKPGPSDPSPQAEKETCPACADSGYFCQYCSTPPSDTALVKALEIVDLYFSPWGAAKSAKWEEITNDSSFDAEVALKFVQMHLRSAARRAGARSEPRAGVLAWLAEQDDRFRCA